MFDPKPLIALTRRAVKSGFKTLLLHDRMLMQCYDLNIDSDIGLHYILHIPDTEEYEDPFYDEDVLLRVAEVNAAYKTGHDVLETKRKERGLKNKDCREEAYWIDGDVDGFRMLKFLFFVQDDLVATSVQPVPYPLDITDSTVENILETVTNGLRRLKPGGMCFLVDGIKLGIIDRVLDAHEIYHFVVRHNRKKLRIPITKSMFLGQRSLDSLYLSVQESELDHVYIYALSMTKKGLNETLWGYILSY